MKNVIRVNKSAMKDWEYDAACKQAKKESKSFRDNRKAKNNKWVSD